MPGARDSDADRLPTRGGYGPSPPPRPEGAFLIGSWQGPRPRRRGCGRATRSSPSTGGRSARPRPDRRLDRLPAQATIRLEMLRGGEPRPQRLPLAMRTGSRPGVPAPSPPRRHPEAHRGPDRGPRPGNAGRPPAPSPETPPAPDRRPEAPKPGPDPAAGPRQAQDPSQARDASPAVSIPPPVRSPLAHPVPPPQAEDSADLAPRRDRAARAARATCGAKLERQPAPPQEARRAGPAARP